MELLLLPVIEGGGSMDIIVDIRQGSPTFGRHLRLELSARDRRQVFIPAGFARGMYTLEPETEVIYKVTNFYSPAHDKGVRWNDPALDIDWPASAAEATVSPKDQALPLFADMPP
jgi:dTDP-4-dehydrorhamnose 3,5-epimerase